MLSEINLINWLVVTKCSGPTVFVKTREIVCANLVCSWQNYGNEYLAIIRGTWELEENIPLICFTICELFKLHKFHIILIISRPVCLQSLLRNLYQVPNFSCDRFIVCCCQTSLLLLLIVVFDGSITLISDHNMTLSWPE